MNIFATSNCPRRSALYLDDKRLVKMCLETTQLLSSAIWLNGGEGPYRLTHKGHPCTLWTAENQENWNWLWTHGLHLCFEYTKRYNKRHKCQDIIANMYGLHFLHLPYAREITPFPNCTTYKDIPNVHEAYCRYMLDKWAGDARPATARIRHD